MSISLEIKKLINQTIDLTDKGSIRVAEKKNGNWSVNQWVKKAILLSFRVNQMTMSKGPYTTWYDKVPGKSVLWNESDWKKTKLDHHLATDNVPEHSYWHYKRIV